MVSSDFLVWPFRAKYWVQTAGKPRPVHDEGRVVPAEQRTDPPLLAPCDTGTPMEQHHRGEGTLTVGQAQVAVNGHAGEPLADGEREAADVRRRQPPRRLGRRARAAAEDE